MRPQLILITFVLGLSTLLYSQTDTIPKHYELKGQAYTQADSILDVWKHTQYGVILKKHKIKMSCAKCDNVFMDIILEIQEDGKLGEGSKVVKTVKCNETQFSEKLYHDFIIFFENLIFPPSLRSLRFQYRLGTGLKC